MGRKSVPDSAAAVFEGFEQSASAVLAEEKPEHVGRFMREVVRMDPRRIVRDGAYVRNWRNEEEYASFRDGVRARGEVLDPIGVREAGGGFDTRYVLVYGSQRLEVALELGFDEVPVRNHGSITEADAVLLQGQENDLRQEMHHVDRALMYHALVENHGFRQADICRALGRDDGQVSVLCRTGAAIVKLADEERRALYSTPGVTVRAFQRVARLELAERVTALRDMLQKPGAGKGTAAGPFRARDDHGGRRFSYQWTPRSLSKDPLGFADALSAGLADELGSLLEHLEQVDSKEVADAVERLRRAQEALRRPETARNPR